MEDNTIEITPMGVKVTARKMYNLPTNFAVWADFYPKYAQGHGWDDEILITIEDAKRYGLIKDQEQCV